MPNPVVPSQGDLPPPAPHRVRLTIHDGVADVRLDRPEKHNALDVAMIDALIAAAGIISATPSVRVVVLSGEGPSFCAGLDFPSFTADAATLIPHFMDDMFGPANRAQHVSWAWHTLRVPVIAALHGHVYGGGLQIALGADIRIVHPDARLSVMEIKWGLIPDMGFTQTVLRHVRPDVAKELAFTGRKVSAEEAVWIGLCTRIADDPLAAAHALARDIAARNPDAIRADKELVNGAFGLDAPASFALEARLQRALLGTPNQMEAVLANFEARPPRFTDPE